MRIGLLLGSFNPVTIAHVTIASAVLSSGLCDKVLFVVAKHNPWKKDVPAPFGLRCQMIEEAVKPLGDKCEVCRFEEKHEAPVYSYIPITEALETYKGDIIYLIGGSDTIRKIPKWKNFETHIKNKIMFIEATRGEQDSTKGMNETPCMFLRECYYSKEFEAHVEKLCLQRVDISSTSVRWMIANGMNPYPFVSEGVNKIIKDNNLYR